jgi:hypothetical protein
LPRPNGMISPIIEITVIGVDIDAIRGIAEVLK